jgi:potassium-transporting ATPase KdpC subunit
MKKTLLQATLSTLVLTVMLGILYPLVMTSVSQVAFPGNANGQIIRTHGRVIGSKIIGQQFTDVVLKADGKPRLDDDGNPVTTPDKRYFQSRPSGTVPPYNAAASTFSNLGPNDVATRDAIEANMKSYLTLERPYDPGLTTSGIPVDAADTSASGIDPDISPANAAIQAHRIADVRHLPMAAVRRLIDRYTHGRGLGFSGEPGVDVLQLNLALDRATNGGR